MALPEVSPEIVVKACELLAMMEKKERLHIDEYCLAQALCEFKGRTKDVRTGE